ncbi:MAG: glycosyltransferase family 39 protein [Phycisphaerae bacterium]|nr:glycosyltransferase family 39 protein [Phycisphaerae bacterium]
MTFLGSAVVLITEILSVPRWVSRGGVAIAWLVVCAAGLIALSRTKDPDAIEYDPQIVGDREKLDLVTRALLCVSAFMAVLVAITAVLAPPSGIDGMVYHMPRVAMWISNHNVGFFPTANYTQLIYGAFAEYSMLHTMELWGSDRFVNLVQFFSFLGSAVAVSYIVKRLGGGRWAQALGALVCISIPEGVLEASGPMTTYSNAFWIASTVAFLLAQNEDPSWLNTVCVGLGAGLAIFTKGTTYIILPFLVLACWWVATRESKVLFLKRCLVMVALIFVVNGPQYVRNYQFNGKPLGLPMDYGAVDFRIQDIGIRSTAASILRNISLHTGTPLESLNEKEEKFYRAAMRSFGVDADDDRQVIWAEPFIVNHMSFQELLAGNPWHFALLLIALALIFAKAGDPANRVVLWYSVGLITAFVAFSALLKWQRWSSRYFLPFFVLGAAIIAMALSRYVSRRVVTLIAVFLVSWGLLNASINRFRSLVPFGHWQTAYEPRKTMYFSYNNEYMAPSYIAAAEEVNKTDCANVGIDSYTALSDHDIKRSPDSFFTYPILAIIHADGRTRNAWFAGVHNLSAKYAASQPHAAACAIVCLDCAKTPAKWQEYAKFQNHAVFQDAVVFTNRK